LFDLIDGWCLVGTSVFVDVIPERASRLAFALRVPAAALGVISLGFLCYRTRSRTWLLIVSLAGVTCLATVVPDLLLGGQRSSIPRFALPWLVAVQLSVAHLLATGITLRRVWQRRASQVVLAGLIGGGLVSNAVSSQAVRWWNKGQNNKIPQTALVINQSQRPFVLSASGPDHLANVLALSHRLEPRVRLWLMRDANAPRIPDGFSDVFLFMPSVPLQREYEARGYQIEPTDSPGLRRMVRRENP
jgi:uncharacterized membrane protein